ncbi:MAG TPA: phosphatase PAP2 family protein, partial [Micromonosporaceae bacterium]
QESNPIAAMPSMHSAYALMIVCFFLPTVRKRWWPLLLAYPLAMTFTLVYSGEHYITDVLMGWLYVGITFALVQVAERLIASYRARRRKATAEAAPVSPVPVGDAVLSPGVRVAQRNADADEPAAP